MSHKRPDNHKIKKGITHSGKFHADDVFSTALLRLINPEIEIERTFTIPEGFDGIVYDIGLGKFDHHQEDAEVRENGVPYAAFGLIWREFAAEWLAETFDCDRLFSENSADEIALENDDLSDFDAVLRDVKFYDEKFVAPLDLHDNTGMGHPIADVIGNINPCWDEDADDEKRDIAFWRAVGFAKEILLDLKRNILAERRARIIVEKALTESTDGIVMLNQYLPWKPVLSGSGAFFVVYPSQRGGYSAQHVAQSGAEDEKFYYYFPKAWRGKENLNEISGVETLRFCHNSGFLIAADTLDDCIKACKIAIELAELE